MGSTLKKTISLLMNKTCILNFLNEFRELFDRGIMIYGLHTISSSSRLFVFDKCDCFYIFNLDICCMIDVIEFWIRVRPESDYALEVIYAF